MTDRIDFRAIPVDVSGEETVANERRFRASVETAFFSLDDIISSIDGLGAGVTTLIFTVTDDAGDGTVSGDANATDYTGQQDALGTFANVIANSLAYFTHKGIVYIYVGPRPVQIGVGGNYTTVPADFTPFGTGVSWDDIQDKPATFPPSPHTHVEADIVDLDKYTKAQVDASQAVQDQRLDDHTGDTDNPHDTSYNNLLDREPQDDHVHARRMNAWERTGVETHNELGTYVFDDLVAFEGTIYHCIAASVTGPFDLADWVPIAATTATGITLNYRWDSGTSGDPGSGRFAITDAIDNPTNTIRVSDLTQRDISVSDFWSTITTGDWILFVEGTGGAESGVWVASGPSVDQGPYHTIPVNWVANTGEPENNRQGDVSIIGNPLSRVPPGGETEARLTKTGPGDYEMDWLLSDRVKWRYPYVDGTLYPQHSMVRDGDWTMIANKDTTERAAPQEDGNDQWTSPDLPNWVYAQHTGVVESGASFNVTDTITLVQLQIWAPVVSATTNYVIRTFSYPTDEPEKVVYQEISEPLLVEDNWTTVGSPRSLVLPGTTVGILLNVLNSGSSTQVGPFDWTRGANSNTGAPETGHWNRTNNENIVRIHWLDADSQDRQANLTGVIAGSTISIVDKSDATKSVTYNTASSERTNGASYEWDVVVRSEGVGGQPATSAPCVITITVPLPSATSYVLETDGHAAQPNVTGNLFLDGVEQPNQEDTSFGVRILFDTWTLSEDWDVVSLVGSSGISGGGGGGVSDFINLIDTPASYVGFSGSSVVVNETEDGLIFGDGGGGASVTTGDTFPVDPGIGDLHYMTRDPVGLFVFYDDGDSQQWVTTTDSSASGGPTTIVEAGAGWQVWGDALIQWGQAVTNSSGYARITMPQAYAASADYRATCTPTNTEITTDNVSAMVHQHAAGEFDLWAQRGANAVTWGFNWMVIGEAPDDLKLPKEVSGGAGGGGGASEFIALTDTPTDYAGQAGLVAAVNSTEDGLEFVAGGGGGDDYVSKTDTAQQTIVSDFEIRSTTPSLQLHSDGNSSAVMQFRHSGAINSGLYATLATLSSANRVELTTYDAGFVERTYAFQKNGQSLIDNSVLRKVDADALYGGGGSVTTGDTFPPDPAEGDLHYMTADTPGLFLWYVDPTSSQWVQTNGGGGEGQEFTDWADTSLGAGTVEFSLPPNVYEIKLGFVGVSLSGTNTILMQLSTGGVYVTTGYVSNTVRHNAGGMAEIASTTGFQYQMSNATYENWGNTNFTKSPYSNAWVVDGQIANGSLIYQTAGGLVLAGELDGIRIAASGTNVFDKGSMFIRYKTS